MEAILDPRTQLLVAVGAAAAAKCQRCFVKLHGMAGAANVSERELRAAVAIAAKVSERAQHYMAEFVEDTMGSSARADEGGRRTPAGCGCD